jgi:phosphoenolpyruvate carboxylase
MRSEDPAAPLRADIRTLGDALGVVLRTQGEPGLFDTVERVRALSKAARAGDTHAADALDGVLLALAPRRAHDVARAFSTFLDLANVAEQHHRVRRRRAWLAAGAAPQRASPEDTLIQLRDAGFSAETLARSVAELRVELVLTAHPTQAERRTRSAKLLAIGGLLDERDHAPRTDAERAAWEARLERTLTSAWHTPGGRRRRPTPEDEARDGLVVVEQVLWRAVPAFVRGLDRALSAIGAPPLPDDAAPVRFGSWMGGDRDGNPNVTPETTRRASLLGRWMAAHLLYGEIEALRDELSVTPATEALVAAAGDDHEPYRALLKPLRERLAATRAWAAAALDDAAIEANPPADVLLNVEEIATTLGACADSLRTVGLGILTDGRLRDVRRQVACFGLTLLPLDLRQEAARHTDALDVVTRAAGLGAYAEWDEATRVAFLVETLDGGRPLIPPDLWESPETPAPARDVLGTFAVAARAPKGALGAYVISLARTPSDVLAVELLQKEARMRWATARSGPPLRVVPLFETLAGLEGAGEMVARLLAIPWVRDRIASAHGGRHEVMIGYSDSAKEVGRLAASWALYRAQEDVVAASRAAGVRVTLFHGRGASVGRGGGPTHLAVRGQPPGSVDGALRVTEQGEAILAKFGLFGVAVRTMDVYTSAVLEATLTPTSAPLPAWRGCVTRLADTSRQAFRRVLEDPAFLPYFHACTPLLELDRLRLGSRPARRTAGTDLAGLRAIPWQFAWTQVRLLVPAWLGVGEALRGALDAGDEPLLREMLAGWPFFTSTIDLLEMTLAKALPDVQARYEALLVPEDKRATGRDLRARFTATKLLIERLRGRPLLADAPVLARSIAVRNPYVDPLNILQAVLLRRVRAARAAGDVVDPELERALLTTIRGVAAGMRNTG